MRAAGDGPHRRWLRGLIVILWRAGLRIQEALALAEADLDHVRGALLVRHGKGGLRRKAVEAGVRRRFAPHQFRHAPRRRNGTRRRTAGRLIQRQLGHSNLGITSIYLQGIDNAEIIETVHAQRAPMIPVSAQLRR